jgi:methionyl-tRNA synthetase
VERLSEPSYFFRLSAFQDRLLAWYRDHPQCILPRSRYNEVVSFVERGLKDLSVSRTSLRWGVPYPNDPEHVVYVWLDALTNYISALGFGADSDTLFQEHWPADVHLVGKDILRFHCVYWPAFLMSAGLEPPHQVFGHGWWLRDNAKMSKSIGNVVRSDYLIDRFGPDPLRYFLAREMAFGQDASFSDEAFFERFNADLANSLGNAAQRTLSMTHRYLDGKVPAATGDGPIPAAAAETVTRLAACMNALEPHRALEAVWKLLADINGYIQEQQPWALARQGESSRGALEAVLYTSMEGLRITSMLIDPFMPEIAAQLRRQLGVGDRQVDLETATAWGGLPRGTTLGKAQPLFPRIDINAYKKEIMVSQEAQPAAKGQAESKAEDLLSIDEFARIRLVIGVVLEAEQIPRSKKLIRMKVDIGEAEPRPLVAGIAEVYQARDLVGRRIVVVANLKPARLMGAESRGMLLAATDQEGKPHLLAPDSEVAPGATVR